MTREGASGAVAGMVPAGGSAVWALGCTKKSLPKALFLSFPLADVHYGEGGGRPVQPARVQHHRLHIRPRGTDVSAGPLCLVGDTGWPRASSAVRGWWER